MIKKLKDYMNWPLWIRRIVAAIAVTLFWFSTILAIKLIWYAIVYTWNLIP